MNMHLFHYSACGFCNIHDVMNLLTLIWFVYYLVTMYFIITYIRRWVHGYVCSYAYVWTYVTLVFSIRYLWSKKFFNETPYSWSCHIWHKYSNMVHVCKVQRQQWKYVILWESTYVTRPAKINHVSAKKSPIFSFLLYHNLRTIYSNKTKSVSLMQNLMGFLPKFTELGYL